jgi:uncharacterized protein (TIGR00299 family) protein
MKIGYLDCFSGVSGDMILGALVSAGAPETAVQEAVRALNLPGVDVRFSKVLRSYISAISAEVITPQSPEERHLPEMLGIVEKAKIKQSVKLQALQILSRMGEVEAGIHSAESGHVHLHELGGDDTLADIIGALAAADALGCEHWTCSPLPLGRGWGKSMHGALPLPAPATLALLEGAEVEFRDVPFELVTPTGAALVSALASEFGGFPTMTLKSIGWGAGKRELDWPNVLRIWIGESTKKGNQYLVEELEELTTSIDDLNPQLYDLLMERLFSAGALDVTLTPQMMKKNRPAVRLEVLCEPQNGDKLGHLILAETTTLGFRRHSLQRWSLGRTLNPVQTPYGEIRFKIAQWDGIEKAMPEYEDCIKAAKEHQMPLQVVMQAARKFYEEGKEHS